MILSLSWRLCYHTCYLRPYQVIFVSLYTSIVCPVLVVKLLNEFEKDNEPFVSRHGGSKKPYKLLLDQNTLKSDEIRDLELVL